MSDPQIREPFSSSAPWSWHNPVRVRYGRDGRSGLAEVLRDCRLLIVTTRRGRRQLAGDRLLAAVPEQNRVCWVDSVQANPDLAWMEDTRRALGDESFDAVLGFGGGSALDAAKVLAVSLSAECRRLPLPQLLADASLIAGARTPAVHAVPTTAGTGSEVTPFATVWDHASKKKHSLAGASMFPAFAWVDPALTDEVPLPVTLSTGLDAINQAMESVWNKNATPVTLALATRALKAGLWALPVLMRQPGERRARDLMSEASLLAGLAISQTRTALCHSISYPLTAHFGLSHGLACAWTMPAVLDFALAADDGRLRELGQALLGAGATPESLRGLFNGLHRELKMPQHCREALGPPDHLLALLPEMFTPGRADNFFCPVTENDLWAIIRQAFFGLNSN